MFLKPSFRMAPPGSSRGPVKVRHVRSFSDSEEVTFAACVGEELWYEDMLANYGMSFDFMYTGVWTGASHWGWDNSRIQKAEERSKVQTHSLRTNLAKSTTQAQKQAEENEAQDVGEVRRVTSYGKPWLEVHIMIGFYSEMPVGFARRCLRAVLALRLRTWTT